MSKYIEYIYLDPAAGIQKIYLDLATGIELPAELKIYILSLYMLN